MPIIRYPSAEQVRALREEKCISLFAAHRILKEDAISNAIERLPELGTDPYVVEVLQAMMALIKHDRY
jgi:hypothetical protein